MSERVQAAVDPDATIVLPTPGKRRTASQYAPPLDRQAAAADLSALGGLNPLVAAANPILAVVPQIRHALRHPDPFGLRQQLLEKLQAFQRDAKAAGFPEERVYIAGYALCALLDESAGATPWGEKWGGSLTSELYGDASGAEKFYALLDKMIAEPGNFPELLDLFYACLALGFEGRYSGGEGGRAAIAQLRDRLCAIVTQGRGGQPKELAVHWRGISAPTRRMPTALALWATASGCAGLLAVVYLGFGASLAGLSDPVARQLARLKPVPVVRATAAPVRPSPEAPAKVTSLVAGRLGAEIARGELAVSDANAISTIVLNSDRLFASGSARLDGTLHPLILRVADALNDVPGAILVTGHSDDVPIHTARFPSNWELSTERARSVAALMATRMREPGRVRAEGVADSEPLVPNDNAANRARNRRVAIVVRPAP